MKLTENKGDIAYMFTISVGLICYYDVYESEGIIVGSKYFSILALRQV